MSTPERLREESISLGITILGAVGFGYWQGSWAAGLFMFCLLDILSDIPKIVVRGGG